MSDWQQERIESGKYTSLNGGRGDCWAADSPEASECAERKVADVSQDIRTNILS